MNIVPRILHVATAEDNYSIEIRYTTTSGVIAFDCNRVGCSVRVVLNNNISIGSLGTDGVTMSVLAGTTPANFLVRMQKYTATTYRMVISGTLLGGWEFVAFCADLTSLYRN